jgi:hypothetical protein
MDSTTFFLSHSINFAQAPAPFFPEVNGGNIIMPSPFLPPMPPFLPSTDITVGAVLTLGAELILGAALGAELMLGVELGVELGAQFAGVLSHMEVAALTMH